MLLVAAVVCSASGAAQGAGFTWTGAVSSDWFNTNNWTPHGVPGGSDTAVITGGSKGLGLAMATRFAASGADVAILARRPDAGDRNRDRPT